MGKVLHLHNTPSFYLAYMENWLAHQRKAKANPAAIAIIEDLTEIVKVGVAQLEPVPADQAENKN